MIKIISDILPNGGVLHKDESGLFSYYLTEDDFRDGNFVDTQNDYTSFEIFIRGLVVELLSREIGCKNTPISDRYKQYILDQKNKTKNNDK